MRWDQNRAVDERGVRVSLMGGRPLEGRERSPAGRG